MASAFRRKKPPRVARGFRLQAEEAAACALVASAFRRKKPARPILCTTSVMAHPYPAHHSRLPYTGKYRYFLTFSTDRRRPIFVDDAPVASVRTQILRAAGELRFEIDAYCFMPDHVHLIAAGGDEASDAKRFIKRAKQYSGYYFKKDYGEPLWQRYGYERVIREDVELALTIRYILENPVQAGLVEHPANYPYLGSQRYTVEELLAIAEYSTSA